MMVDLHRLLERPAAEQQRMLAALRFQDIAAFREACAGVCRSLDGLKGNKRWSWLSFLWKEFQRDAREVPEAAVAMFMIRAAREVNAMARARSKPRGRRRKLSPCGKA